MYDEQVFEMIEKINPSWRGELEITDVNNMYIQRGNLCFNVLNKCWTDAGTFNSLSTANTLAKESGLDIQIKDTLGESVAGM